MMDAASAIGFGLAFVAAAWLSSAALGAAVALARPRRLGPAADRAAAAGALVIPPVLAAAMTTALVVQSAASGGADHCAAHGHHLHLCVFHGGGWGAQPVAVVALAMIGALVATRLVQILTAVAAARRRLTRMRRLTGLAGDVIVVPSATAFCFVAGLIRPRIYVSTATWDALADDERAAMLAHERAHLTARDPARRFGLGLLALLGAPGVAARMLARWSAATERVCDAAAARAIDPAAVASALVRMARCRAEPPAAAIGFPAGGDTIARIESLLAGASTGAHAGTVIRRLTWTGLAVSIAAVGVLADPIHHVLETLLGAF